MPVKNPEEPLDPQKWPIRVEPYFYIETWSSSGKQNHMIYRNDNEEKYKYFAEDLKKKLIDLIPDLEIKNGKDQHGDVVWHKVLVNQFHDDMINCTDHDLDIHSRARKGRRLNNIWTSYATKRYAFEVYFMGIRLYSKITCRLWPSTSLVAQKCFKAYTDYMQGNDIS